MRGDVPLSYERDGVWTLRLNRHSRRRFIDPEPYLALADALASAERSGDVRRPL